MHLPSSPFRDIAASVTLACFAVGLFSAHGTDAVRTHLAVAEARAAAQELSADREVFAASLGEARRVAQEAAAVDHDEQVAQAAAALDRAMADASATVTDEGSTPEASPEPEESEAPVEIVVDGVTEAGATTHGKSGDDSAEDADPEPASSPAPAEEGNEHTSPTSADLSAAIGKQKSAAVADRVEAATQDATDVLAGEVTSRQEAHELAAALTEASTVIDRATLRLDEEASALAVATAAVELELGAARLDAMATKARARLDEATADAAAVGRRVASATTVTSVLEAASSLTTALDDADAADRRNAAEVEDARVAVSAASTTLDRAIADLQSAHEEWIDSENDRRDAVNDEREALYDKQVAQARVEHEDANRAAVAARANGWSGQPVGVAGANGRLGSGGLCTVDFTDGHVLQCDAAQALEDADDAYHDETGRHLVVTDTYRSYGLQVTTRARKPSTAAMPGTSNHGWGMAIDLDGPSSAWLRANGDRFGWVHPLWARPGGTKPESWHLEYVATDVGAFEAPDEPALLEPVTSVFDDD